MPGQRKDLLRRRLRDPSFAESYRDYLAIVTANAQPRPRGAALVAKLARLRRRGRAV